MTDLEARILLNTGMPLKKHIQKMLGDNNPALVLATSLGIHEKTIRNYAKRYGFQISKRVYVNRVTCWKKFNYKNSKKILAQE